MAVDSWTSLVYSRRKRRDWKGVGIADKVHIEAMDAYIEKRRVVPTSCLKFVWRTTSSATLMLLAWKAQLGGTSCEDYPQNFAQSNQSFCLITLVVLPILVGGRQSTFSPSLKRLESAGLRLLPSGSGILHRASINFFEVKGGGGGIAAAREVGLG